MKEKENEKMENMQTHNNIVASIIIPVYNAENTLPKCLDSLANQTINNYEVICIDGGSSDNSLEILNNYAKILPIRIIKQENGESGISLELGIDLARGEYLFLVNANDYVKPEFLETICTVGKEQAADIVLFDGEYFNDVTGKRTSAYYFLQKNILPTNREIFSIQDCPETIFQISYPQPCMRAYRRNFIIEMEQYIFTSSNAEELLFTHLSMAIAKKIAFTTKKLYCHRGYDSISAEKKKKLLSLHFIDMYLTLAYWLDKTGLFDLCKKSFGISFFNNIIRFIQVADSVATKQNLYNRLQRDDIVRLHVLDKSDAYYNNDRRFRQVRYFLQNFQRASIETPKVSVIIPVFNVEKYVADCLESLLNQTMHDFEIICVDDGSTDNSLEILTLYSRLDSRISVILGNHCGAAAARNQGIKLSRGTYLYFMDSDDLAADTLLEKAYTAAENANADVVIFDAFLLNDKSKKISYPDHYLRKELLPTGETVFSVTDVHEYIFQISNPAPWTKIFKRNYILQKQLSFQNLPNSNDAYFVQMALALADRITVIDERLYFYRSGIITNLQSKKDQAPDCIIDVYLETRKKLIGEGIWSLCESSWVNEFLAVMCFSIKTLSKRKSYRTLYQRLTSSDIRSLGILDHDETYYQDLYHYKLLKNFLSSPIKFADITERDTKALVLGNVKNPIVSVIIPVYNVDKYLAECLSSIQMQTLKNIEIICIDDGSTDNSLSVLCQVAKEDPRISILVQRNSGLSAARNSGIQIARGKYLYYIDSDDLLEKDALQFLVESMEDNNLDCIFFGGKTFYETEKLRLEHQDYVNYYQYTAACMEPTNGPDLLVILNRSNEFRASACMQMVKTELIRQHDISFYEGIVHEDELYTLKVLLYSQHCMAISEQFYLRRVQENSIITSSSSITRLLGILICYTESIQLQEQFDLTGAQYDAIYQMQNRYIYHIKKNYFALTGDERLWIYSFCTGTQRCVYNALVNLFNSTKPNRVSSSAVLDKRLSDHDAALQNAQKELAENCIRLNDHDTALKYAQEELAQNRVRLNDHDTALKYAQKELATDNMRLNDHDAALGYLQADIVGINNKISEIQYNRNKTLKKIVVWLPQKVKSLFH